jgi:cell division protein FtsZ
MLFEVDEAATRIREEADQNANIIVGASLDESLEGIVRVSVVATAR